MKKLCSEAGDTISIECIENTEEKGRCYHLLKVKAFGCEKYAICMSCDDGCDIGFLECPNDRARDVFKTFADGELSVIHLFDALSDVQKLFA